MSRVITTRTTRCWVGEDGIVRAVLLPGSEQTLADAEENIRAFGVLLGDQRRPALIDYRRMRAIDRAARAYYAGPETAARVSAAGLVVASPVSRIVGNFFVHLYGRTSVPTRLFDDEAEALGWLKGFLR